MDPHSPSPVSFRPRNMRRSTSFSTRSARQTFTQKMSKRLFSLQKKATKIFWSLTPLQRLAVVLLGFTLFAFGVLSLVFHEQIFKWLTGFAKGWRDLTGGWLILWAITFFVSFPPLIGYSTCVMLGGYVYGFPNG
jgi:hypothetical protein